MYPNPPLARINPYSQSSDWRIERGDRQLRNSAQKLIPENKGLSTETGEGSVAPETCPPGNVNNNYYYLSPIIAGRCRFEMDQKGLTVKDLEPMIGKSNRVYDVLNHKRLLALKKLPG